MSDLSQLGSCTPLLCKKATRAREALFKFIVCVFGYQMKCPIPKDGKSSPTFQEVRPSSSSATFIAPDLFPISVASVFVRFVRVPTLTFGAESASVDSEAATGRANDDSKAAVAKTLKARERRMWLTSAILTDLAIRLCPTLLQPFWRMLRVREFCSKLT